MTPSPEWAVEQAKEVVSNLKRRDPSVAAWIALEHDIALALVARERETWEAALRLLADHEDHDGAGTHGRTDGRVSDCIGDLEQVFRAAALAPKAPQ